MDHFRRIITAFTAVIAVVMGSLMFLPTAAQAAPCEEGGSVCIDSVTPNQGSIAGGTVVTIRGNHFTDFSINSVRFGGTPGTAFARVSDEELVVTTPTHTAGSVTIELFEDEWLMHTRVDGFRYRPPATVTWVATLDAGIGAKLSFSNLKTSLEYQVSKFAEQTAVGSAIVKIAIKAATGNAPETKSLASTTKASKKRAVCKLAKNKKSVKMLRAGTCTISAQLSVKARKKAPKRKAVKRNVKLIVTVK